MYLNTISPVYAEGMCFLESISAKYKNRGTMEVRQD